MNQCRPTFRAKWPGLLEVAEAAQGHFIQSRVAATYRRSDLFEKHRLPAGKWARQCQ